MTFQLSCCVMLDTECGQESGNSLPLCCKSLQRSHSPILVTVPALVVFYVVQKVPGVRPHRRWDEGIAR
jgi:hypothetical protein